MERMMSVEEKIRRAEEIYARRQEVNTRPYATVKVNEEKKDIKLLKKMIIQIIVCVIIYFGIYVIQNNNYFFSEDFIQQAKNILSYDIDFAKLYNNAKQGILTLKGNLEGLTKNNEQQTDTNATDIENNKENNKENNIETENDNTDYQNNNAIGGAIEGQEQNQNSQEQIQNNQEEIQNNQEQTQAEISQEEQDILQIKNTTNFIKPVEGAISSKYGTREPTTSTVPKNHTGTDIAANTGTKILSATDGEVVLASEEGDYGKHLKIQIGDVSIIYAHCNMLYVKLGDKIIQGQEIAEVGTTGNSTGPHLHFEIRYQERTIDPEKILSL